VKLSIVTPAFNEAGNLEALYRRLVQSQERLGGDWEWIIVDDHSRDETFAVIERLSLVDQRVHGFRLARNSGSHVAITCGLHQAQGDAAIMMAADLQDPPELIERMVERWREGFEVVWAARRGRPSIFSAVYYWIMRRVAGMSAMPANGADFFLADRVVLDAFRRCTERNVSVLALLTWIGFRQTHVEYDKQPRAAGRSGWTLARKIKLVVDSVTAFSDFPIRACGYAGAALLVTAVLLGLGGLAGLALLPALGAVVILILAAMLGLTGVQLLAVAVIGEYVWRALDESRRRPQYLIERASGQTVPLPISTP
jgi:dolichol-phosphate mannosyltransferase